MTPSFPVIPSGSPVPALQWPYVLIGQILSICGTSAVAFDLWTHFSHAPQNPPPQVFSLNTHPAAMLLCVPRQHLSAEVSPKEQLWVRNTGLPRPEVCLPGNQLQRPPNFYFVFCRNTGLNNQMAESFYLKIGTLPIGKLPVTSLKTKLAETKGKIPRKHSMDLKRVSVSE